MPRVAGQIDRAKNEAILDAASTVLFEQGLTAPLDEIARRAAVSKQTIYNHYGSKAALVQALIERRSDSIASTLEPPAPGTPLVEVLTAYARALLESVNQERGIAMGRLLIQSAPTMPDLAEAAYVASVQAGRIRLASFLEREDRAGRLTVPDPQLASSFFAGMVVAQFQMRGLVGLPLELTPARVDYIAREAARRFIRAYAP